jgi:hypothetical protein
MRSIILIIFIFVIACNSDEEATNDTTTSPKDTVTELRYVAKTPLNLSGCYGWIAGEDTATLQLTVTGNKVSGDLIYDWSEKDRNSGKLQGVLQDSLILANYTFLSEGVSSVREVVFKIKGDSLFEGSGNVDASKDTIKYKNITKLKFAGDHPFIKGICTE